MMVPTTTSRSPERRPRWRITHPRWPRKRARKRVYLTNSTMVQAGLPVRFQVELPGPSKQLMVLKWMEVVPIKFHIEWEIKAPFSARQRLTLMIYGEISKAYRNKLIWRGPWKGKQTRRNFSRRCRHLRSSWQRTRDPPTRRGDPGSSQIKTEWKASRLMRRALTPRMITGN